MESRYYPGVEADVIKLTTELRDLFDEDFDVQTMQVSSTAVLQARKSSTLREITGLAAAVTIKITPRPAARGSKSACRNGSTKLLSPQWLSSCRVC